MATEKKKRQGRLRPLLEEILDGLVETGAFVELEAGQGGDGPVVRGYRLLRKARPEALREWLKSD